MSGSAVVDLPDFAIEELLALWRRNPDGTLLAEILDLFAGPGGWSEGIRRLLGLCDIGVEWDASACATRAAAGHRTIRADVAKIPLERLVGLVRALIASPPCQLFSAAGTGAGRDAIAILGWAMERLCAGEDVREEARLLAAEAIYESDTEGRRLVDALDHADHAIGQAYNACLVLEPARYAEALKPEWIALEQVPAVLPLWEVLAAGLRKHGYRVWTGVLNSADYGVPQTRKRAILMAHRDRVVALPEPTHAQDPQPTLFGPMPQQWVTMAAALGWGLSKDPSPVLMTARGRQTGHDVLRGSSWRHEQLKQAMEDPDRWVLNRRQQNGDGSAVPPVPLERPAPTLTAQAGAKGVWVFERPATTIVASFRPDIVAAPGWRGPGDGGRQNAEGSYQITVTEAALLQSFPEDYPFQGSRSKQFEQVGNAIPCLLAAHVIAALEGVDITAEVAA